MIVQAIRNPGIVALSWIWLMLVTSTWAENRERSLGEMAFRAQVQASADVQTAISPGSAIDNEWEHRTRWAVNHKAVSTFVLVHITPALIDAAVQYWGEQHVSLDGESQAKARDRLTRKLIRPGEMAFLLIVKPIEVGSYPDEWGIKVGPIDETIVLVSLDGKIGKVTTFERVLILDDVLDGNTGIKSCLFWLEDVTVPDRDPIFNVRLTVDYHVRAGPEERRRKNSTGPPVWTWIENKSSTPVSFRFETTEIHVLQLVEQGVPWIEI